MALDERVVPGAEGLGAGWASNGLMTVGTGHRSAAMMLKDSFHASMVWSTSSSVCAIET